MRDMNTSSHEPSRRGNDQPQEGDNEEEPGTAAQNRDRNGDPNAPILIHPGSNVNLPRIMVSLPRFIVPTKSPILQNVPRMTHYIEEPNVAKGFMNEQCFSSDGRLICSPFGFGVRLLSFSPECSELSTCVPKSHAFKLYEIGNNFCHRDIVVSTKFSPKHCLLVSGCLNGRICWHQPVM